MSRLPLRYHRHHSSKNKMNPDTEREREGGGVLGNSIGSKASTLMLYLNRETAPALCGALNHPKRRAAMLLRLTIS